MTRLPRGYSRPLALGTGASGSVVRVFRDDLGEFRVLKFAHDRHASFGEIGATPNSGTPLQYQAFRHHGRTVLEMEWIQGTTLAESWEGAHFDPELFAVQIVWILRALENLHRTTLHGDIKPEHLLLCASGEVRWLDLGLSSSVGSPRLRGGSPRYLHPELSMEGARPARHHDVHAVRMVLRESLGTLQADLLGACLPRLHERLFGTDPLLEANAESWMSEVDGICREFATKENHARLRGRIEAAFRRKMAKICREAARKASRRWALFHLQEAMEWDPDDSESLELLAGLGSERPATAWWLAAGIGAIVIASSVAFFATSRSGSVPGKDPANAIVPHASNSSKIDVIETDRSADQTGDTDGVFRTFPSSNATGLLVLNGFSGCSVVIDGDPVRSDSIRIPSGIHRLRWNCQDGLPGSRVLNVLPHQEISIDH